ncbi:MAG: hypothetical protein KKG62_01205 [Actinobacteria bacterium]|nr:hypothetical protein [Actinomycetota bacterium]
MMPTGSELRALKIIDEEGGEIPVQVVSRRMGIETSYARLLCTSLARADYIDLLGKGVCRITAKGKEALKK